MQVRRQLRRQCALDRFSIRPPRKVPTKDSAVPETDKEYADYVARKQQEYQSLGGK